MYTVDFDPQGKTDINGNLKIYIDLEALYIAIKLWIVSFRGERLNQPNKGGIVLQYLLKPMSEESASSIQMALREGLRTDFEPKINVTECLVIPDYENAIYRIHVEGYCEEINSYVDYNDKFRGTV